MLFYFFHFCNSKFVNRQINNQLTIPFRLFYDLIFFNKSRKYDFNSIVLNEVIFKNFKKEQSINILLKVLYFNLLHSVNEKYINNLHIKRNSNFLNKNILFKNLEKKVYKINKNKNILLKSFNNQLIYVGESFKNNITNKWKIYFSASTLDKYINIFNSSYFILFLRKNKVFNKGRYSRNRQTYRTGVYWCLYVNVVLIIGLYFLFYRFSMNFGYLWWGLFLFIFTFIFSKALKYSFFNIKNLILEWGKIIKWLIAFFK